MTGNKFRAACQSVFLEFKESVPNPKTRVAGYYINAYGNRQRGSTGNMAYNASRIEFANEKSCRIYMDEKIAPYVPYTIEAWISPRWKGKKNPNEGWFEQATESIATALTRKFKGVLIRR